MNERDEFIARMEASGITPTWSTIYDLNVSVAALRADLATAERERDRMRKAAVDQNHQIEQTLGAALGYPRYCDDPTNFPGATEADGVCVGDHVAETLAKEAAQDIEKYRARLVEANADRERLYSINRPSSHDEAQARSRLLGYIAAVSRLGGQASTLAMRIKEAFDELQTARFVEARDKMRRELEVEK